MSVTYIPNPLFESQLKVSEELNVELLAAGEATASVARALVPVVTGTLRDSIHAERGEPGEVDVIADAPYAAFVEAGTINMAAQPFLAPALETVAR